MVTVESRPARNELTSEDLERVVTANQETGHLSWGEFRATLGVENNSNLTVLFLQAEKFMLDSFGPPTRDNRRNQSIVWEATVEGEKFEIKLLWNKGGPAGEVFVSVTKPLAKNNKKDKAGDENPHQPRLF